MSNTATLIRKLTDFTGDARLYEVDPPMTYGTWDADSDESVDVETRHVVVSATVAPFSGPETYIFPANARRLVQGFARPRGGASQRGLSPGGADSVIVAVFILALWAAFAWFIHEDIQALIRQQQDEDDQ